MPNGISGKKKKRAVIALVIALCMCFVSMVGTALMQSNWGNASTKTYYVTTAELAAMIAENNQQTGRDIQVTFTEDATARFSFMTMVPKTATADNPAPAVICVHGGANTKEMHMNGYIELVRRGFVVVSIDMAEHGYTDAAVNGLTGESYGALAAVEYAMSLPNVDAERVGVTGHSMGAGLEDAIAVRCLNTGLVPPIANFKEADPELEGITLSKGGHYNFKYALRLAAGFGSQLGMTLLEKMWQEGEPRIADEAKHQAWLKEISGQQAPVLEVVQNTLRIKDNYQHGVKPALVMEGSQAFVDKVNAIHAHEAAAPAAQPAVSAPVTPAPAAKAVALDEAAVTKEVVKMVGEKTGYPEDMLDIDLDMEADLGIDTVKQAELFASLREHYGIAQQDGIQLKDYPTIRHCIKFVLANAGKPAAAAPVAPAPVAAPAAQPAVVNAPVTPAPAAKAVALDEAAVTKEVVGMVAEKTGYPEVREHYGIAQQDGIQLKDYPTIRHCIKFVLANAGKPAAAAPVAPAPAAAAAAQPAVASAPVTPAPAAAPTAKAVALDEAAVTKEVVAMVAEKTGYPEDMLELLP